jgi:hypothetical protein
MKKINLTIIINYTLGIYLAAWLFYSVLNWDVFSIKLNTNIGFTTIGGYPFVFFFLFGFTALLTIKYFINLSMIRTNKSERERIHRIAILEKDIELLKMKEVLFKMQTSEMGKNSSNLNALHEKLDELSAKMSDTDDSAKKFIDKELNEEDTK